MPADRNGAVAAKYLTHRRTVRPQIAVIIVHSLGRGVEASQSKLILWVSLTGRAQPERFHAVTAACRSSAAQKKRTATSGR
jgi:hypothetical protein